MDPVYIMVYLMVALILVLSLLFSVMLYMVILLKGSLREAKKHSRLFVRLARHLHDNLAASVTPLPTTPESTSRGGVSPPGTPGPIVRAGATDALAATTPMPRV